jgi:hypothetical protein
VTTRRALFHGIGDVPSLAVETEPVPSPAVAGNPFTLDDPAAIAEALADLDPAYAVASLVSRAADASNDRRASILVQAALRAPEARSRHRPTSAFRGVAAIRIAFPGRVIPVRPSRPAGTSA